MSENKTDPTPVVPTASTAPTGPDATVPPTVDPDVQAVFLYGDSVVTSIETIVGTGHVDITNILIICTNCMQLVEKIPKLTGAQKKALVIYALNKVLEKRNLDKTLLVLIPTYIDMAVQINNGDVSITPVPEAVSGCCGLRK